MNKIEDLLHKEIANIIVTRIDNPQIKNTVTITDIKVSKDIRSAIVYFVTLDKNFKKVEKIIDNLLSNLLLNDKNLRDDLSYNMSKIAMPNASFDIVDLIKKHLKND